MRIATLAIITRENKVLLGLKQGGSEIGDGTLNGPCGKFDPKRDKTILDCVVREVHEEVGLTLDPTKVEKCAVITFFHSGVWEAVPDFEVHVYRTSHFTGVAQETVSMIPAWYDINDLSTEKICKQMLESDYTWFPHLVHGGKFNANVFYSDEKAKGFLHTKFLSFAE